MLHIIYQTKDAGCIVYVGAAVTGITNETIWCACIACFTLSWNTASHYYNFVNFSNMCI